MTRHYRARRYVRRGCLGCLWLPLSLAAAFAVVVLAVAL